MRKNNETPKLEKLDFTKPMKLRNGGKVRILCTDGPADQPIVGLYKDEVETWSLSGYYSKDGHIGGMDLVNVPEKRTVWLYEVPHRVVSDGEFYPSYYSVRNEWADANCISRIKVEFESGRNDE